MATLLSACTLGLAQCPRSLHARRVETATSKTEPSHVAVGAAEGIVALAAYKFAVMTDLPVLREKLLRRCLELNLKGTILLSEEGINAFVSGTSDEVATLLGELRSLPGLADLEAKLSPAEDRPFNRMLVRIKKEIIAFGVDGVDPARHPSPRVTAQQLKQWLDEGRDITLLDTRNDYEVELGTFVGAIDPKVKTFRGFPAAVANLPEALKDRTVVTFCTGGIRCEKAAPYLEKAGFKDVYQLDGGILKYFEEVGGAHYQGECFVFDKRVGLNPAFEASETVMCFACLMPVSAEAQRHPHYVYEKSCPKCYVHINPQTGKPQHKPQQQQHLASTSKHG